MVLPATALPRPAHHYRPPNVLQDIRLLDLLELCGTTPVSAGGGLAGAGAPGGA
jgi:hypothetical protein